MYILLGIVASKNISMTFVCVIPSLFIAKVDFPYQKWRYRMIDLHCHILPGIDDGAKTMEDSITMAMAAYEEGIHTIVATPHHQNGRFINVKEMVIEKVEELNEELEIKGVPIKILPGQEVRIHGDLLEELSKGIAIGVGNTTNYLLIEFPSGHVPQFANQILYDLKVEGYRPVIVHPERNREIMENPSVLYELVKKGIFTQDNRSKCCWKIREKNSNFFPSTHRSKSHPFYRLGCP